MGFKVRQSDKKSCVFLSQVIYKKNKDKQKIWMTEPENPPLTGIPGEKRENKGEQ